MKNLDDVIGTPQVSGTSTIQNWETDNSENAEGGVERASPLPGVHIQ
jgi:hypothetical protein